MTEEKNKPQEVAHWSQVVVLIVCIIMVFAPLVSIKTNEARQARRQATISVRAERDHKNCVQLLANVVEPVTLVHVHYYYVSPEPDIGLLRGYSNDAGTTIVSGDRCPIHSKAEWVNQASDVAIVTKGPDGKFSYQPSPWLLGSWTVAINKKK